MTIKREDSGTWAGDVLTGHEGFDNKPSGRPFQERSIAESLIEMNTMIHDLKAKIDKIEADLEYHVHFVGDLPHSI